jgi:hypothetical protein
MPVSNKHNIGFDNRGDGRSIDTPRPPDDLERNPGIGASKGVFSRTGADPEEIQGENTIEGDVLNDVSPSGAVTLNRVGRSNK